MAASTPKLAVQFWDTVRYEKIVECYKCQLDEHWFDLTKDTLRDALHITPVDNNNAFSFPLTLDALINFVNDLGLTRNTSRFERPRTPVLQILWGVVNQAHIDCVERIWEEFTKSIHTFIKDKKNLTQHTQGKKKSTLIVILSVRFTKLIIYHLQSKHKFHPRPNSPLLGYLEFSAKGTKKEVFEMPILNELNTADIQEEQYYKEYMEKLAKHQRYLVGKEWSDLESPTPKPVKATKNSKPSAHKADLRLPVRKLASSQQPKPKPEPTKKPDSGKFQPLLEVRGKAKRKRTLASTEPSGHNKSSSIYAALRLTDSASESDKEVPLVVNVEAQDEGHAGPNLGVPTEGQARSDLGTLSSLQHLAKDFSFDDLLFNNKPSEADNGRKTTEAKAESMVDLLEADTKEILHQRMWETNFYKTHKDDMMLYEALEKSMNRNHTDELVKHLAEARRKKKKRLLPQPPPPPSTNQEGLSHGSTAPSSLKTVASAKYTAWTTTDTRLRLFVSLIPKDLHMDDDMAPDAQSHSFDDEDIRLATPEPAWFIPSSDLHVPTNNWASALVSTYIPLPKDSLLVQTGPAFELVKVFHPNVIHPEYQMEELYKLLTDSVDESIIRHNVSKPLPLGGPPGKVIIQSEFFFNKDLEYMIYDSKGSKHALSILKIKVTYYPNVGLEQMVPDQMWIEEECKHISEGDRRAVQTHMLILSVVRIEVFSMYGDKYGVQMIMRFNEIYKFSNGTLHQIDEALDYRFKEFKVNKMNPGLNTRFLTRKDMDRSKEFMFAIQRRLKTRRIFRNLESFVGGRVREGDYRLL
nr:hypothetical protein [Tanacetum cinerariifolium]